MRELVPIRIARDTTRFVQAGGGRVSISGNKKVGHDIHWVTAVGDNVLVERKDRSYEAGLTDSDEDRAAKVVEEVENACIPVRPKTLRVLTVGFQHLVPGTEEEMGRIDGIHANALKSAFGGNPSGPLPHLVIVEHIGLEARTSGEKSNFFSPHEVNPGASLMRRVGPLIMLAISSNR